MAPGGCSFPSASSLPSGRWLSTDSPDSSPLTPEHPTPSHPRLTANPSRRTDPRPAQYPLERRAARQPVVARVERPGDALAPRRAAPAGTARPIEPAVPRTAPDAIGAPRAIRRARYRIPAAQTAKALARRHARPRPARQIHVIGAADQSPRTRPRNPRAAPAPIRRARQNLGINPRAAPPQSESANDRRPNPPPQPTQHPTPRHPAGIPPGQRIEPLVIHRHFPHRNEAHVPAPFRVLPFCQPGPLGPGAGSAGFMNGSPAASRIRRTAPDSRSTRSSTPGTCLPNCTSPSNTRPPPRTARRNRSGSSRPRLPLASPATTRSRPARRCTGAASPSRTRTRCRCS